MRRNFFVILGVQFFCFLLLKSESSLTSVMPQIWFPFHHETGSILFPYLALQLVFIFILFSALRMHFDSILRMKNYLFVRIDSQNNSYILAFFRILQPPLAFVGIFSVQQFLFLVVEEESALQSFLFSAEVFWLLSAWALLYFSASLVLKKTELLHIILFVVYVLLTLLAFRIPWLRVLIPLYANPPGELPMMLLQVFLFPAALFLGYFALQRIRRAGVYH